MSDIPNVNIAIDTTAKKAALVATALFAILGVLYTVKIGIANTTATRAETAEVADMMAALGPSDPQTHFTLANLLERTFLPSDLTRSLAEYETAAALSPHHYNFWVELGRARERSGDAEGAERALRRAYELAPNYARVQWTLGNNLVRQGRTEEGFAEIRKAVEGDPTYTDPAASIAWQILDGDLAQVRAVLGESPRLNASLARLLANQKRYDEAATVWNSISPDARASDLAETGRQLTRTMLDAKLFRNARRIDADIRGETAAIGESVDPGFESALKLQGAGPFEWQIAPGGQPQIAPTSGQRRGGGTSLVMIFNSPDGKDFRQVSQLVPVEPGASYELQAFYRAELKGQPYLRWTVADAATGQVLATTEPVTNAADWTALRAKFAVPANSDGISLAVRRDGCPGLCPLAGNVWFDDVTLKPVTK